MLVIKLLKGLDKEDFLDVVVSMAEVMARYDFESGDSWFYDILSDNYDGCFEYLRMKENGLRTDADGTEQR